MKEKILLTLFLLFCASLFALTLRGNPGNPTSTELNTEAWKEEGPLELSPERGRYALTYSLIEDKSFQFSLPLARFTTPDLGYKDGKYVSLFAPGVSYILMPGYIVGKLFGSSQVGTYAMISLFAVLNGFLIYVIARQLGARPIPASLGALAFLFGTPAFAYGVSLYQHHISTFMILLSFVVLLSTRSFWATAIIWFLYAWSLPLDYPNLVLMTPIAIYALGRLILVDRKDEKLTLRFHAGGLVTFFSVLVPLLFFVWFNFNSYGNPYQLSGTLPRVKEIDEFGLPTRSIFDTRSTLIETSQNTFEKSATGFFKTRNVLNGLYILFISPDRGIIYYAPIMLFGIFGATLLFRRNSSIFIVMISVIGSSIVFYSLWGDPWGGWAFGSRYLIPAYSLLAILLGIAIDSMRKQIVFMILLMSVFFYSTGVNTLGAITSNKIPPQIEVLAMEALSGKEEKYTFARDYDYLVSGKTKSFIYNQFVHGYMTPYIYYISIVSMLSAVYAGLLCYWYFISRKKQV